MRVGEGSRPPGTAAKSAPESEAGSAPESTTAPEPSSSKLPALSSGGSGADDDAVRTTVRPAPARPKPDSPYLRAENEDDDGYDPYSDRRSEPPLFERDPWN